ncbi:gliding motility-associated ABC transporter substrate-binding protein GldG [Dysgonomonas sp. 216]|uniref:gliding motility-associated ABC transporter substrate-binding protein GldG n=1 Tax=Dysgonomonas sp. 216 TaxID=2302934 RepID=UPI0013D2740E|nr:gliding motility-associated ABC transporter substrate-binding protein GldG [Dysgonomonas sp. 216]NDW18003.1 gliding motility-associated ABC transporter substrate-binding protein GldG [Dysgonomonas sp. 216]
MRTLLKKELTNLFCSSYFIFFSVIFLLSAGLMNWYIPGSFNIPDGSYANLNSFFSLAAILLLILIPALTMRSFSEEKKNKTLDVLRTYPVKLSSVYVSKFIALSIVVFLTLVSTIIYIYVLYELANTVGNINFNEIILSYIVLWFLSFIFIAVGLFSSSITNNQVISLISAIVINFVIFFGFDLVSTLFDSGSLQLLIASFGIVKHYNLMQKAVVGIDDVLLIFNYISIFSILAIYFLNFKDKRNARFLAISAITVFLINIIVVFTPNTRFDFTADKRYTLSDYSIGQLKTIADKNEQLNVKIYLEGDLNSGFQHLQNSIKDLTDNFNRYANGNIKVEYINPNTLASRERLYELMSEKNMRGITLNEVSIDGKTSQKIIYPYAEVISDKDTLNVSLLKSIAGYSAEENINASIENLEFEFMDAIRILNANEPTDIAFIDGHGEIPRAYVFDAEELLSKYYFVNRGQITDNISILDSFKAVIIAGTTEKFNEKEKYILDQYIMSGGKVLWLIDGAYLSHEMMASEGESPSMKNETNLDNLLFTYGIRINPDLLQDTQCTSVMLTSGDNENNNFIEAPFYFAPLLLPSISHPVTKDISLVKSRFVSSIDVTGSNPDVNKTVLLTTSTQSHIVKVPEMVDFSNSQIQNPREYFNLSFIPTAIALEGKFVSAYKNRTAPDGINTENKLQKDISEHTKMIVISSSDIIRNEITSQNGQNVMIPMGFDRLSGQQYGNRDFIVNAVNWLVNDDEWFSLRSKQQQIRLLNKQIAYTKKNSYAFVNIAIPLVFIFLITGSFYTLRKFRYEK